MSPSRPKSKRVAPSSGSQGPCSLMLSPRFAERWRERSQPTNSEPPSSVPKSWEMRKPRTTTIPHWPCDRGQRVINLCDDWGSQPNGPLKIPFHWLMIDGGDHVCSMMIHRATETREGLHVWVQVESIVEKLSAAVTHSPKLHLLLPCLLRNLRRQFAVNRQALICYLHVRSASLLIKQIMESTTNLTNWITS